MNLDGNGSEDTTKRITLSTKIASLCAMAYCLYSFYWGVLIDDSARVFLSVAVLVFVLVSCRLLEMLFNDKVKRIAK
jgi:hypothetical protein